MLDPFRASRAALVLIAAIITNTAFAGDKQQAAKHIPAVPGFARFHDGDKADADGGRLLYATLNCASCHGPQSATKPAAILDAVGMRVKRSYLKQFLTDPHATKPGTTMPNPFANDPEKDAKVEALVQYLASTGSPAQAKPDGKGIAAGQD